MYSDFDSSGPEDFVKTVLSWSFETFEEPLFIAVEQPPLPSREGNITQYYHNFLPFILEESRSIIAEGLEKVSLLEQASRKSQKKKKTSHLNEAKPFDLVLKKKPRFPQNEDNPLSMVFRGAIPEKIEHGRSMNVLLLKTKRNADFPEKQFLALASENGNSTELFLKIILTYSDFEDYHPYFEEGARWHAHYLGSLISEERMYDACLVATDTPCIRQIARSQIPEPRFVASPAGLADLNLSQKRAISAFMNAREQSTLLLQGPPGTGKTTTLVSLLKEIAGRNKRVLVSAHSNKGVQVLASRALKDIADVPMILVGVEGKIPPELKPIFLNRWHDIITEHLSIHRNELELLAEGEFSEVKVATQTILLNIENNIQSALQQLNKFGLILSKLTTMTARTTLFNLSANPFCTADFERLEQLINSVRLQPHAKEKWMVLYDALILFQDKWSKIKKYNLEKYLLNYARVVFATLITSGRDSMLSMDPIDFLLVDEAAQSVEAATLIPMRYKPKKVLLVGDTKQLPATVISKALDDAPRDTEAKNYKWSMMWRLIEENDQPSLMLTEQYRMHPHICQWPSGQYYADRLITSPKILPMKPLSNMGITSRPYAIYQVSGQDVKDDLSHSMCNKEEANYVVNIIRLIRSESSESNIGVITPYVAQKRLINEHLNRDRYLLKSVDVNTVDGFQGDERDIIIISFTRTHVSQFLKEFRRLNVAITRPKSCLIILGSPSLLSGDIKQMIEDARMRNVLYSEPELKSILANRVVSVASGESSSSSIDRRLSAWRGDAESQFIYAQRLEAVDKPMAFIWYRRAAENEHAAAQHHISKVYLLGNAFTEEDTWLGILWLQKSARGHCPQAQYDFAMLYLEGKVIAKNVANALYWAELAAQNDYIYAILFLAKCYEEGVIVEKDENKAKNYYRKAAKLGNTDSMLKLATLLSKGTNDNKREAIKWYRKLAQDGYSIAYYLLAELLNHVSNNQAEALTWYLQAADEGYTKAQFEVGMRLKEGLYGCKIDIPKSMAYFKLAAVSGHIDAQFIYATALKEGNGVAINMKEAAVFFKKAADNGHVEAQYQYALLKQRDSRYEAYVYYKKAAKENHNLAQYACILYQIKFNCDLVECLEFCQKLAIEGDSKIQFIYARLLHSGIAGRIDKAKAFHYYSLLAKSNHFEAQYYCGLILEEGTVSIAQDLSLARHYYQQCTEHVLLAKLRLARLLLQDKDHWLNDKKAIDMLIFFCDNFQENKMAAALTIELQLDRLTQKNQLFDLSGFIASIDTLSVYANYVLSMMFKEGSRVTQSDSRAILFLKKAADAGHVEAQYQYALLKEKESPQDAYSYYKEAAKEDHRLAQYACIYYQTQYNRDLNDCLALCEKLSCAGESSPKFLNAKLNLARLLLQDKDYLKNERKALEILGFCSADSEELDIAHQLRQLKLSNSSFDLLIASINTFSVNANYMFGIYFKEKRPSIASNLKAMIFLKKAADAGHVEAQYQYALLKEKESPRDAYSYYKKAAKEDHVLAQYACIRYQLQFSCDLEDCLNFCEQLSIDRNFPFKFVLARLLDSGIAMRIDKAKAYYYYSEAAKDGHKLAYYYCANMLVEGRGVEKNISLALKYYTECSGDYFEAKLRLGCLLLQYHNYNSDKALIAEKEKQAVDLLKFYYEHYEGEKLYFLNFAEQNLEAIINKSHVNVSMLIPRICTQSVEANYYLGRIFEEGKGMPIDAERALYHYHRAGISHVDARYRIGYIHEFGVGNVERNRGDAREFYQQAANRGHELAAKRLTLQYSFLSMMSDMSDAALIEEKKDAPRIEEKKDNCLIM
jgi:TPR repeat protein